MSTLLTANRASRGGGRQLSPPPTGFPQFSLPTDHNIVFECTRLNDPSLDFLSRNRNGVIRPDKDGCYTVVIGSLDSYNSRGEKYVLNKSRDFIESNANFLRKIERGALHAEVDHPIKEPGMTDAFFAMRYQSIRLGNCCGTWRRIKLGHKPVKDERGRNVIPIIGTIFPAYAHGAELAKDFETPGQNVFFSIRAITANTVVNEGLQRRTHKVILDIITFDRVDEPGLWNAEKLLSPSCESFGSNSSSIAVASYNADYLRSVLKDNQEIDGISMESLTSSSLIQNLDEFLAYEKTLEKKGRDKSAVIMESW